MTDHRRRENILIAIAAGDRRISDGAAGFAIEAVSRNAKPGNYNFSTFIASDIRGYAKMRNTCVKLFLESPCDRLWFIDDDVLPPGNVFDLLEVDGDIVIAPYPFIGDMRPVGMCLADPLDLTKGTAEPKEAGPVKEITGCGMGCTLIRRAVLEDERMRFSTVYEDLSDPPRVLDQRDEQDSLPAVFRFHLKPDGQTLIGEDLDFGLRATRLGYKVKIHTGISCDHLKPIGLNHARSIVEGQLLEGEIARSQKVLHVR